MWPFKRKKEQESPEQKKKITPDALAVFDDVESGSVAEVEKLRRQFIEENVIQKKAPQPTALDGVAMDSSCNNSSMAGADFSRIGSKVFSYFVASSSFIGYHAMAVIGQHWLVRKGLEKKPRDAVRKWYELAIHDGKDSSEIIKKIEHIDKKFRLKENTVEAITFNRMFGIRHILFKHKDPNFDYSEPFNPDAFKDGNYAGIAQIDPYWITPELDNSALTNPADIDFYEPEWWLVQGKRYHKSHFIILKGDHVPDYLKPTYRYGGISMTQKIYERVYAAERTANEAPQLVMTKRLYVMKADLEKAQANKKQFMKNLETSTQFRDNYGYQIANIGEEINQLDTALGDLDAVIMGQYAIVCAIIGDPVSKIMGSGHSGFSTGETDDDYYTQELEEMQGNDIQEVCEAHYERLIPSLGLDQMPEIIWNPIKVMSEKDEAEVQESKSRTAAAYYGIGAIDDVDVRDKLTNDYNSGFNGLRKVEILDDPEA